MSKLQTNAIRHLGSSVDNMTLDSSGRLFTPQQPAFWANRTAGNVTGPIIIVFNNIGVNRGSHYNASNGRFTVPVAGAYEFHVSLLTTTSARCQAEIRVNGAGRTVLEQGASYGFQQGSMNLLLNLNANDYVEVALNSSSDAMYGSGYNSFSGKLIG